MKRYLVLLLPSIGVLILMAFSTFSGFAAGQILSKVDQEIAVHDKITDESLQPLVNVWNELERNYLPSPSEEEKGIDRDKQLEGAIRGLVGSIEDPYTSFFPKIEKEFFESEIVDGEFAGVGMEITIREDKLVVVRPLKGSPAERAGILPDDVITHIDGEEVSDISSTNAAMKIRGPIGTTVVLTVSREEKELEISVVRENIVIPSIETKIVDDVFVIEVSGFSKRQRLILEEH